MKIRDAIVLWALTLFSFSAAASVLDPTFDPGSGANGIVEQVLPLADGKILICGNFTTFNGRDRSYMARLNSNGSLDDTFFAQASYWVRNMSVQADGKIVIGGFFNGVQGASRALIARLNSDGSLDTSFNPGSGATNSLGTAIDGNADPFVFWTAIQPDGKILATGNFRNYNGATSVGLVRINPDGSRDASFDVGGGLDSWGRFIRLLPNGQILVSGWFNNYKNKSSNRIVRINPDGSPDYSFTSFFGDRTAIYSIAPLADGKMIVAGHSLNIDGLFTREMERLNPDGSVDTSFVGFSNEKTESLVLQSDGKIILGGYFSAVDGTPRTSIARMFPDGTLDGSFQAQIDNYVWSTALQADGKLLISGGFYTVDGISRNGVARLLTGATGTPVDPPPTPSAAVPVLSPVGGSYAGPQIISMSTPTARAEIRYTLDGSEPTASSARYGGSFTITSTTTVKAKTFRAGYQPSATVSATYTIATNPNANFKFIAIDSTTRGSWRGTYGSSGFVEAGKNPSLPAFAQVTLSGKQDWVWTAVTRDFRAMQATDSPLRIASGWYGDPITVDLNFTDTAMHRVSFYFCDWDSSGRAETVELLNGDSNQVIQTIPLYTYSGGLHLVWDLKGHFKLHLTKTAGPNALLNGIYISPAP